MAETKEINPLTKSILELGPLVVFFVAFLIMRDNTYTVGGVAYDGFIAVTAVFIPLLIVCTLVLWRLSGKLSAMQVATLVLVVVFGGLTVWLNDDRFFKMKPTLIYLIFAALLAIGLLRGQSYLQIVLAEMMPLQPEGWMILTRRLMVFFLLLAAANEVVWRNFSDTVWVYFKVIGLTVAMFAFFMTQAGLFEKYGIEPDEE